MFVLVVTFHFSAAPSNAASKTARLNKSNATLTEGKTLQLKVVMQQLFQHVSSYKTPFTYLLVVFI